MLQETTRQTDRITPRMSLVVHDQNVCQCIRCGRNILILREKGKPNLTKTLKLHLQGCEFQDEIVEKFSSLKGIMCPPKKRSMRPTFIALISLIPLVVMSCLLIVSQEKKEGVVNNIPPIEEEKAEKIESCLLAVKERERIERPLLVAKEKEKMTSTSKKEMDNTSFLPWVVELFSSVHYKEAEHLASRLKGQGFPAFVSWINLKEQKWYRVRVGAYPTEEDAQKMKERIDKEFGMTDSWVHLLHTPTPHKLFGQGT